VIHLVSAVPSESFGGHIMSKGLWPPQSQYPALFLPYIVGAFETYCMETILEAWSHSRTTLTTEFVILIKAEFILYVWQHG
jgi:hypothetical protein